MSTALVTGANRGIGLELTRQLRERGDRVIAVCRQASDALNATGADLIDGVDVSQLSDVRTLAQRLDGTPLDVLINNAGILRRQSLDVMNEQVVDDMLDQFRVNSIGPLLVTQALRGNLARGARVAIITSRMGSIEDNTSGGAYGYRMSKAAVNSAGKSLAHDLRDQGVAVALLHPGYVRTEMTRGGGDVEAADAARGLLERIDALTPQTSGGFWHASGSELPW